MYTHQPGFLVSLSSIVNTLDSHTTLFYESPCSHHLEQHTNLKYNSQYPSYQCFMSREAYLPETPLQSQHPWTSLRSNCNKLCIVNNCDTNICISKHSLSKTDHHSTIKPIYSIVIFKIWKRVQLSILSSSQFCK